MLRPLLLVLSIVIFSCPIATVAQTPVDEDDVGAWYMYFFNTGFDNSQWGLQGDVQYRNWDMGGDLEQLLLRGGVTWASSTGNAIFTLGYANITSGEFGSSDATSYESRVYQEALLKQSLGSRLKIRHRFRYEQRWVEDQDFRTRFRYALFADIPLNRTDLNQGAWYLAFYNEVFLNGERDIGNSRRVEVFDRNRTYGALGHSLTNRVKIQAGYMHQSTNSVDKGQFQLSLHHSF